MAMASVMADARSSGPSPMIRGNAGPSNARLGLFPQPPPHRADLTRIKLARATRF